MHPLSELIPNHAMYNLFQPLVGWVSRRSELGEQDTCPPENQALQSRSRYLELTPTP